MMEGIRGLLETMFDSVVMVSDEISLLETLARLDPDFAVVDLSLDVTRESDVAVLLNRYDPELKFIVLSTHEESRNHGKNACRQGLRLMFSRVQQAGI